MNAKQISISSSKPIVLAGGPVILTCSASFGSEDSSTSGVRYVWSGPAMSDYNIKLQMMASGPIYRYGLLPVQMLELRSGP